jgi:putative nucleotidyltransferase with HDIG domain
MDQQNNRLAGFNSDYLKYFMMVFCVAIIVFVLPKGRKFKYEFEKGKPWMHERLLAPFDFAIDKTPEEYEQEKNRVIAGMIPYYRVDMEQDSAIIHKFRKEFSGAWNSSYGAVESSRKIENEKTGLRLTRYVLDRGIIELSNEHKPYTPGKEIYVVNGKNATLSSFGSHLLLKDAYKEIRRKIPQDHDLDTSIILLAIQNSLTPTIFYDQDLTSKATSEEIKKIALSKGMSRKDDVIIESGNIVDEGKFRVLESLKNEYDKRLGMLGNKWIVTLGQVLLIGLILALLMFFLSMFRKDIYADNRKMFIILLIVTTMLVVLSWALRMKIPSLYFIPYCIVPIIIRVIFDTRLALYIHLLVVIIAGFFVPNGYEFIFLQITAGMVAINSIKNLLRRSQFLASAILIYLTYVVGFIGISIIHEGSFLNIQWENVLWFMISVVLSLLAYPLIYAFEKLFGITTEVTLMEYTNINTPLLRELSYKAPGTFQHSLQVANLAEAAVFEIGGNALLIRAGALYHDVGKIESPQYFIENQQKGINPHDQLSDEDSAKVIIRHVYAGIELANKHRLPQEIIDFIRTHHGSTRVDFFYHSFIKNYPELSINEKMFRYPGPIPFSKETAILMLADSVEAASRSLKEPSAQSIDDLVERIIDYKVSQQQLIDSDITIKEIYRIKAIFKEMLKSIYHVRIEY